MPYKSEKLAINNEKLDRRVKLTAAMKDKIREEYATGSISINALARKYEVSKRLIQFTLFPERQEQAKKNFAERQKDGRYYDREAHKKSANLHRAYKHDLYKRGLLDSEDTTK